MIIYESPKVELIKLRTEDFTTGSDSSIWTGPDIPGGGGGGGTDIGGQIPGGDDWWDDPTPTPEP